MTKEDISFRSYDDDPLTVGELREMLSGYSDETKISFGSTVAAVPLVFCRVKRRGEHTVQIELNEKFPQPGIYNVTVDDDMGSCGIEAPHLQRG